MMGLVEGLSGQSKVFGWENLEGTEGSARKGFYVLPHVQRSISPGTTEEGKSSRFVERQLQEVKAKRRRSIGEEHPKESREHETRGRQEKKRVSVEFWKDELDWCREEDALIEAQVHVREEVEEDELPVQRPSLDPEVLNQGVTFLCDTILAEASQDFKDQFAAFDPRAMMFVLTKSVWMYVCGPKREEAILRAFKDETRTGIEDLRRRLEEHDFGELFENIETFERGPSDDSMMDKWRLLGRVVIGEIQGGPFITECFAGAINRLPS